MEDGYVRVSGELTFWSKPGTLIYVIDGDAFYVSKLGTGEGSIVNEAGLSIAWYGPILEVPT